MIKLNESLLRIQESAKDKQVDFSSGDLRQLINIYGDLIFEELTDIFNIIFSSRNSEFEEFTVEFVKDKFTIPEIKLVIKTVIEMNELESLLPFSIDSFRETFWKEVQKIMKKQKPEKN